MTRIFWNFVMLLLIVRPVIIVLKAYATIRFLFEYALPITIFAYCYGRIFHTIRRQSKVVTGHVGRSHDIPTATASRGQNPGQVQQQATGAATSDAKLSRTEMNVLKTMIAVIICFIVCWSVFSIANLLMLLRASTTSSFWHDVDLCVHSRRIVKYWALIFGTDNV